MSRPQFSITTYEVNNEGNYNPILAHTFYGRTFEEAVNYAKSHLETDFFFSSSFIGQMSWKGDVLYLANRVRLVGEVPPAQLNDKLRELAIRAREVNEQQIVYGELQVLQRIR